MCSLAAQNFGTSIVDKLLKWGWEILQECGFDDNGMPALVKRRKTKLTTNAVSTLPASPARPSARTHQSKKNILPPSPGDCHQPHVNIGAGIYMGIPYGSEASSRSSNLRFFLGGGSSRRSAQPYRLTPTRRKSVQVEWQLMTEAKWVETVLSFELERKQEKESRRIKKKKMKPKNEIYREWEGK